MQQFHLCRRRRANHEGIGGDGVPYWANPGSASPPDSRSRIRNVRPCGLLVL